jgi:hypothetical protein
MEACVVRCTAKRKEQASTFKTKKYVSKKYKEQEKSFRKNIPSTACVVFCQFSSTCSFLFREITSVFQGIKVSRICIIVAKFTKMTSTLTAVSQSVVYLFRALHNFD